MLDTSPGLSVDGLLRELLDGLSDQIYAIDAVSGRVLDCNEGACRTLGYSREEMLGLSVPDFDLSIDLAEYQRLIARIIAADREVVLKSTHTRRDGTSFPVEVTARVSTEPGPPLSICVVRDITERLKLEDELREQTRQYESIVRGLPGLIYRYRLGNPSTVLFVDERVREVMGYDAAEFLRGEVSLRQIIVPEDQVRVGEALLLAVATGESVDVTYSVICKDGARKVVRDVLQAFPPDESGMPLIEAISFDVTESAERERVLKEAWLAEHERFETIARAAGLVTYERDMQTNEISWSGLFEEVMGYPLPEHGPQGEWASRTPPDDADRVGRELRSAYGEGRMADVEYRYRRGDGSERWLWLRGMPVFDEEGKLTRSVGMIQDVTERKRLEAQVSAAQRMDTVGALAGGISHDVNNYLTTIMGNLDLALMRLESAAFPELEDARAAAAGCAEIVRNLLTFARQQPPSRVSLKPAEVIGDAIRMIGRLAGPDIQLRADVTDDCPAFYGDRVQIQQVLMNLAVNARDAMGGQGTIAMGAEACLGSLDGTDAATYVRLWVGDTGPGIPNEIRDRIFEPYFTTRSFGGGTGLGLAIVHGIARAHGGWAEVSGGPGGAEISVFLPAAT